MTTLKEEARRLADGVRRELGLHEEENSGVTANIESALLAFAKMVLERRINDEQAHHVGRHCNFAPDDLGSAKAAYMGVTAYLRKELER